MASNDDYLRHVVDNPAETLNAELKTWIDPNTPEGQAKIVKTCIALHHANGGILLIGFDNQTLRPSPKTVSGEVRELFHPDTIQALVSTYAFEAIPVEVNFVKRDGIEYPVLWIDSGVRTPVAIKKELKDSNNKVILKRNAIYVRSLNASGIASTTEATCRDWEKLIGTCFDNREADIGRFFRRYFKDLATMVDVEFPSVEGRLGEILEDGLRRFEESRHRLPSVLSPHGAFEVALLTSEEVRNLSANQSFLNMLASNNPYYSAWPLWRVDTGIRRENHARVYENSWEAMMMNFETQGWLKFLDFWKINPKGRFYHRRALHEDFDFLEQKIEPMKYFDYCLPIWFVAEAIALGIRFAKALRIPNEAKLFFEFRWTSLKERTLFTIFPGRRPLRWNTLTIHSDTIETFSAVSVDTPDSALCECVHSAVKPLFEAFDGYEIPKSFVEHETRELLTHRIG